jgi:hypothetical protein
VLAPKLPAAMQEAASAVAEAAGILVEQGTSERPVLGRGAGVLGVAARAYEYQNQGDSTPTAVGKGNGGRRCGSRRRVGRCSWLCHSDRRADGWNPGPRVWDGSAIVATGAWDATMD